MKIIEILYKKKLYYFESSEETIKFCGNILLKKYLELMKSEWNDYWTNIDDRNEGDHHYTNNIFSIKDNNT